MTAREERRLRREEIVVGKTLMVLAALMLTVLTAGNIYGAIHINKLSGCMSRTIDSTDKRQGFSDDFTNLDIREGQVFVDSIDRKITQAEAKSRIKQIQAERKKKSEERDGYRAPKLEECR